MIKAYAAFESGAPLQTFEYDPGPLDKNHVEMQVLHCGICHSDLSMIDNDWGSSQYPLVPGHEVIGKISAIGDAVTDFAIGDKVGLGWHASFCESCDPCHNGDHNLCSRAHPTIVGRHGGFADHVRASATSVVKLPDALNLETAGPLFCGGSTVFNPLVELDVKAGAKVAVVGIGGLGHLALQFYRAWGCEVTAFTSSADKAKFALEMGAHSTLNSTNPDDIASAKNRFDMIVVTVNVSLEWKLYLRSLAPRGRLHFVGLPQEPIPVRIPVLVGKQLAVSASPTGSPKLISQMLDFAAQHNIQPITEQFAFADVNLALDHLRSGRARYRVVLSHD